MSSLFNENHGNGLVGKFITTYCHAEPTLFSNWVQRPQPTHSTICIVDALQFSTDCVVWLFADLWFLQLTISPSLWIIKRNGSFCIFSDSLKHDATAIHSFIGVIIPKTKVIIPGLLQVFFFSDGGPGHYKNQFNFANLSVFKTDYSIFNEWHFWEMYTNEVFTVKTLVMELVGQSND